MADFLTSWHRGRATCALIGGICALPLPGSAHAGAAMGFAEAAMVTPLPQEVGAMPEPAFVSEVGPGDLNGREPGADTLPPQSLVAVPAPTRQSAARLADVAGPVLAQNDLEARGFTKDERKPPYRTPGDIKRLEIAFQLLNATDAVSTVACLQRDDCQEGNPVYGKRPKPIVVIGAKTVVAGVHYWVMRRLLPDHPGLARAFGWFSVTVQGSVVGLNMSQLF